MDSDPHGLAMADTRLEAVLLVGFGGPESPEEVMPFLERVTQGRGVPRERLESVAEHYYARGGRSPINDQMRDLQARLAEALGPELRVYWGNRNAAPFVADAVRDMANDGVKNAVAFVPSAYSSFSGCRQYRQDIETAIASVDAGEMTITKLRPFHNHPGFIEPFVDALGDIDHLDAPGTVVFFTAHSIPLSMADSCDYEEQLLDTAATIANRLGLSSWSVVYQSRSGPPQVPWLEPDIVEVIDAQPASTDRIVVVPIGFCTDHMEVIQDLDTDAAGAAAARGAAFVRVSTPGSDARFVDMIVRLVDEARFGEPAVALGSLGVRPTPCVTGCCPAPKRPSR